MADQQTRLCSTGRRGSPRKSPVSGRSREHAKVAVAVDARRQHQVGKAVEQLEPGCGTEDDPVRSSGVEHPSMTMQWKCQWGLADGGTGGSASVRIGFLAGDVNQNRVVTISDLLRSMPCCRNS